MSTDQVGNDRDQEVVHAARTVPKKNRQRFGFRIDPDTQLPFNDKLLVTLTILLSLLVFVVAPLQANGVLEDRYFGLILRDRTYSCSLHANSKLVCRWLNCGCHTSHGHCIRDATAGFHNY